MKSGSGTRLQGFDELCKQINSELEEEKDTAVRPDERRLYEVAREILRLERDLTVPGSPSSENVRIERLMNFIEGREF
jgi:hypothetical protein